LWNKAVQKHIFNHPALLGRAAGLLDLLGVEQLGFAEQFQVALWVLGQQGLVQGLAHRVVGE
jgi:hypothetical protein